MAKIPNKKGKGVRANKMPRGIGHTSVQRDKNGLPMPDPPDRKSLLGNLPDPDTGGKAYLEKEKLIGQVEILLLKGVLVPYHIAKTLGISPHTAARYIEAVHTRWAVLGTSTRIKQLKGEARSRLELITNELWAIYTNAEETSVKTTCLSYLMQIHDRRMILDGLTSKNISLENDTPEGMMVDDRVRNHQSMVRLASALLTYVEKSKGATLTGEYTDAEFVERDSSGGSGSVPVGS